jgi:hypothetical protein
MSAPHAVATPTAIDVEVWLAELDLEPLERADRDGIMSWDLRLDGRRRPALRITLIVDPALAVICWAHYAPPIPDSFRKSYRRLLRWNDELPFVKFSIGEDERPLLAIELPIATVDRDAVGLALARLLAVADQLLDESKDWLEAAGWPTRRAGPDADTTGTRLLDRYAASLGELGGPPESTGGAR